MRGLLLFCFGVCHAYVLPTISVDVVNVPETQSRHQDIIVTAKQIISSGLYAIKADIEKIPDNIDNAKPSEEEWLQLNRTLEEFFAKQLSKNDVVGESIIETIRNAFQDLTQRFLLVIKQKLSAQKDYERQVQRPGFISQLFSGGAQNVASNINNLAMTTTTTQRTNIINNVVNSFGSKQPQQTQSTTAAPGFFQGAINQFNKVVSNFRPTTTERNPLEVVQNFGEQIHNMYNGNQAQNYVVQGEQQPTTSQEPLVQANPTANYPMEMLVCYNVGKMMNNRQ